MLEPNEKERRKQERRQKQYDEKHKTINNILYKKCEICEEWYILNTDNFYNNKSSPDNHSPYCKKCEKIKSKKYQDKHKEKTRKYDKIYNKKQKIKRRVTPQECHRKFTPLMKVQMKQWRQNNPDK